MEALPPTTDVGTYLSKSGGKNYFARATYKNPETENPSKRINSLGLAGLIVSAPQKIISGFEHTTNMPVPCFRVIASSRYAAVNEIRCFVSPIVSRMNILLAHRIYQYEKSDWDRIKTASATEWRFEEAAIKSTDQIEAALTRIRASFLEYVEAYIAARFGAPS